MNTITAAVKKAASAGIAMAILSAAGQPVAHADLLVGGDSQVLRYSETTGAFLGVVASGNPLDNVQGIVVGPDRQVYISSFGNRSIVRSDGSRTEVFVPPGSGGMGAPNDVAFGPDRNLYVSDGFFGTYSILRFNGVTGQFMNVFANGGGIRQPGPIAFGPSGDLYVANATSTDVMRFHGGTGLPFPGPGQSGAIFVSGIPGGFNTTLAISANGELIVSSGASSDATRYDAATGRLLGTAASNIVSGDMEFGPDGNLYIANYLDGSVARYRDTSGGLLGTFVPSASGGLDRPTSLTFGTVASEVPEPATYALTVITLAALAVTRRSRRSRRQAESSMDKLWLILVPSAKNESQLLAGRRALGA